MGQDGDRSRWLIVDTGSGRYLGELAGYRDAGDGLTQARELVLKNVVRIDVISLPTRDGIAVQMVPSSPVPWVPLFARESVIHLPLDRVVWYADADESAVTSMRTELLATSGRMPMRM